VAGAVALLAWHRGEVVDQGTHDELLEQCDLYQRNFARYDRRTEDVASGAVAARWHKSNAVSDSIVRTGYGERAPEASQPVNARPGYDVAQSPLEGLRRTGMRTPNVCLIRFSYRPDSISIGTRQQPPIVRAGERFPHPSQAQKWSGGTLPPQPVVFRYEGRPVGSIRRAEKEARWP
jgi:hypothetical protein